MNGTINGSSCHSPFDHPAAKMGQAFAYGFILVASLIGNCLIAMIVYKTQTMRKPINYLIANMAMSALLYPIFLLPRILTQLYVASWLISGPLGQAFCKLVINFLSCVSLGVSAQSLAGFDSSGSIWSCRIPPSFTCYQFKAVSISYSRNVDNRDLF